MYKSFVALMTFFIMIIVWIITLSVSWFEKILVIIITYLMLVFVISRLVIPRLGFKKAGISKTIPKILQKEINKLKGTKEEVLRKSYLLVTNNFKGGEGQTILEFSKLFWTNLNKEWKRGGFAQCNTQNYFLRLFLIKSRKFKDDDIKMVYQVYKFNIHQIIAVKLKEGWVYVDPWAKFKGIPLGRRIDYWFRIKYNPAKYSGLFVKPEYSPK